MQITEKNRLEAFSDGVFAIAITLLILEIQLPHPLQKPNGVELMEALRHLWPSFLAFLLSFAVILIMWINHHELFRMVRAVDYPFLYANGFLLLMVTFVPFPTAVLADHLGTAAANVAAAFYCGTFFLTSVAFNILFWWTTHRRHLLRAELTDEAVARLRRTYRIGLVVYAVSTVAAYYYAAAGLILCTSLWAVWIRLGYTSSRAEQ